MFSQFFKKKRDPSNNDRQNKKSKFGLSEKDLNQKIEKIGIINNQKQFLNDDDQERQKSRNLIESKTTNQNFFNNKNNQKLSEQNKKVKAIITPRKKNPKKISYFEYKGKSEQTQHFPQNSQNNNQNQKVLMKKQDLKRQNSNQDIYQKKQQQQKKLKYKEDNKENTDYFQKKKLVQKTDKQQVLGEKNSIQESYIKSQNGLICNSSQNLRNKFDNEIQKQQQIKQQMHGTVKQGINQTHYTQITLNSEDDITIE
ncbi:hypothetical protein PPERSA_06464 [Pseudocohnilembus persalinus]|uniref:Uncharacterized protein n=1 Tax=Pseudocohnilembus persalinus TaxID=266149 RepID=A0A0V0QR88_PSEPJ|nr:hypothetical protein PPERSA_06464 [Pseudocohnilembus persalinus]|eukprot:KRX04830.1 hypothetical protein PPERSA_06464 [Pseudocohnilembus persalinus]